MTQINQHGQPVGRLLDGWVPPTMVEPVEMVGSNAVLHPLQTDMAAELFDSLADSGDELWTYLPFGPFADVSELETTIRSMLERADWVPFAIEANGKFEGFASYLRVAPSDGVLEIGSIVYSTRLQRTTAATEAIYLMIKHAFDAGYRRVEWKCDDLNEPSRRAGARLGFRYEGTFKNATHYKGRNRDTAWFAIVAEEWDDIRSQFEKWLDPGNFDERGLQVERLLTRPGGD